MTQFYTALPVWEEGKERAMHYFLAFRIPFSGGGPALLRLAASTSYQLFLDGAFVASGPARCAHGCFRVDELPLAPEGEGEHLAAVLVAGYNMNGYALLEQPSFLQAELLRGGQVLAATGRPGIEAYFLPQKVRRVQRFSFQRPFCEEYRIDPDYHALLGAPGYTGQPVPLAPQPQGRLLPRGVPYPEYPPLQPVERVAQGAFWREEPGPYTYYKHVANIGPAIKGYPIQELESFITEEVRGFIYRPDEPAAPAAPLPLELADGHYATVRFPFNGNGHLSLQLETPAGCVLYLLFDEILTDGDVDFLRLNCANVIKYHLSPGVHRLVSFEPYNMQYLKLCVAKGECRVKSLCLRQVVRPHIEKTLPTADGQLRQIYAAALETFRQNAVDLFTDCPQRERAGWLCDSFFTGRAEYALTGENQVEHNFLENYRLPERYKDHPEGMIPMCYPAEHYDGRYIPNWAMWLVLELWEYRQRTGDEGMIAAFRPKIEGLLRYFEKLENEQGLLEKLGTWVFLDGSASNQLVQDVSYPSNVLYGAMLRTAGALYGIQGLEEKGRALLQKTAELAYCPQTGFFSDNAARGEDGALRNTGLSSESGQYYFFLFGAATPQSHPALWQRLLDAFGPHRGPDVYPQVAQSNAFIGVYLRLEMLWRQQCYEQVLREIRAYFAPMAAATGTLWENRTTRSSLNHGFASHVVCWLDALAEMGRL